MFHHFGCYLVTSRSNLAKPATHKVRGCQSQSRQLPPPYGPSDPLRSARGGLQSPQTRNPECRGTCKGWLQGRCRVQGGGHARR